MWCHRARFLSSGASARLASSKVPQSSPSKQYTWRGHSCCTTSQNSRWPMLRDTVAALRTPEDMLSDTSLHPLAFTTTVVYTSYS